MKLTVSFILIILLSVTALRGQENRVSLFTGPSEEQVQSFDTLIYESMTHMSLKIANIEDLEKYNRLKLILTCKLMDGGRKALRPKKYYAQHEITWDKISIKDTDSINVIIFDEKGNSNLDVRKMKRKFKNFSISPTKRKWLEFWANYEYQFKLYGFQESNDKKNISSQGNSSDEQYTHGNILGMSSTFYVRSLRSNRPRVGPLPYLREFLGYFIFVYATI